MHYHLKLRRFWLRYTRYEYWHWSILYVLLLPYLLYLAIVARSYCYFLLVNPSFEHGGFWKYSKKAVLDLIPNAYKPSTYSVFSKEDFLLLIEKKILQLPLIAKPNHGERGTGVVKITVESGIVDFINSIDNEYIIQECVDYTIELGVFYSRLPSEKQGKISSVTSKDFLNVTGDGFKTLQQLIEQHDRALFQYEKLEVTFAKEWDKILPKGENKILEPIGNHCKGTRFINANYLITKELESIFENISRQIDGFQYGRFDLRVPSLADLYAGKNIKILELNGTNSEPTHIYDSSVGLWRALRNLAWHWHRMATICRENKVKI